MAFMQILLLTLSVSIAAISSLTVQRLLLHPLANVPGPRLSAITWLFEFYYDCILGGKFVSHIEELHKKYGPIVRINPNEVHINDPEFFDRLYNVTGKLDKDRWFYAYVNCDGSAFGTPNADLHRIRRKAMSKFFSSAAISKLESTSAKNVEILCKQLEQNRSKNLPVNMSNAFRCFAADSVYAYCMPDPSHLLELHDFAEDYNRQSRTLPLFGIWHRHIPIIIPLFMAMPRWLVKLVSSEGGLLMFDFQNGLAQQAEKAVGAVKRSDRSVLDGIVNSDLPESEKTVDRITQEARVFMGAGTETSGAVLETITYFVLDNPHIKSRLKAELAEVVAQGGSLNSSETIKQLPYLSAVIKEGLRVANAVSGRLCRADPRQAHQFEKYTLPPGTVMSMCINTLHMHTPTFPDPTKFDPERWLDTANLHNLEKYHAPFGRGARSCVGKELALMNLYMTVARFFHQFDAELYETTYEDISLEHDYFAPFPKSSSERLRVMLK